MPYTRGVVERAMTAVCWIEDDLRSGSFEITTAWLSASTTVCAVVEFGDRLVRTMVRVDACDGPSVGDGVGGHGDRSGCRCHHRRPRCWRGGDGSVALTTAERD